MQPWFFQLNLAVPSEGRTQFLRISLLWPPLPGKAIKLFVLFVCLFVSPSLQTLFAGFCLALMDRGGVLAALVSHCMF